VLALARRVGRFRQSRYVRDRDEVDGLALRGPPTTKRASCSSLQEPSAESNCTSRTLSNDRSGKAYNHSDIQHNE
jgi:hypothetical protein